MNWKQISDTMWISDDGVLLKLIPETNVGTARYTRFRLESPFNEKASFDITVSNNVKEKREILDFILSGKETRYISIGDWNRAMWKLNQQRKIYPEFEDEFGGSFYNIKYQKCF